MLRASRPRRRLQLSILALLLLTQFAALLSLPKQAKAAISADPNEEIIYLDNNGVVQILDTHGNPLIEWQSPTNGWERISVADVNNDGDMEILALKESSNSTTVAVFDPVVYKGAVDPNKKINGIPWDTLFEMTFTGIGKYIVGGDFDQNVRGDEMAIGYRDTNERYYVEIWKADGNALDNDGNPSGRKWALHVRKEYAEHYTSAAVGQLTSEGDDGGADELVLVDDDSVESKVDVFQVDADFRRLDGKSSDSNTYRQAAVGQVIENGKEEIAMILSVDRASRESLLVYEMDSSNEMDTDEDWQWAFAPQPEHLFLGDISGNGDEEVFFLRKYPENEDGPRLIMRDDWGGDRDRHPKIELSLDDDNGYQSGAAGDIDGDDKDEIVIVRDNNIRIYMRPDNNVDRSSDIQNYPLPTDKKSVIVADLDRNGFIEGPVFRTNVTLVEASVATGTKSGTYTVRVENQNAATAPITFNALKPAGHNWVTVNPAIATTPFDLIVSFDATDLPVGTYNSTLILASATGQKAVNEPYVVQLQLNVEPAAITPSPAIAGLFNDPCTDPLTAMTQTIKIGGTNDLHFFAAVIAVPTDTVGLASVSGLQGPIAGGEVNGAGDLVLYDAGGNRRTVTAGEVSASATVSASLPIDPALPWLTEVSFDTMQVPGNLTVKADLTVLGADFAPHYAVLVMVADTRAGLPPGNVTVLPITAMCVDGKAILPAVFR